MGTVEEHLREQRSKRGTLLFALLDSENLGARRASEIAKAAEKSGAAVILVGGSSTTDQFEVARVVESIKQSVSIPTILFPGNITGVVPGADAILFTSLLNSENPYYISQAQALGAPNILRFGLEPLPTAYIVVGDGTSAWFVGSVRAIPHDKPKIAAAYSLAARFMGMRFVYLEAGSGARQHITPEMVGAVRSVFDGFLVVGGGIRDALTAGQLADAGADAVVIGTVLEGNDYETKLSEMVSAISAQN